MKCEKIFSMALILGALLGPATFAPTAQGQQGGRKLIANSGVFRLVPGQILRLTINGQRGNDTLNVRFRRSYYAGGASGGVWKTSGVIQDTSAPVTIAADEAVSGDISKGGFDGVRIEAIIRGYTGTTHIGAGSLQIINSDGTVAAFFDIFPEPEL